MEIFELRYFLAVAQNENVHRDISFIKMSKMQTKYTAAEVYAR